VNNATNVYAANAIESVTYARRLNIKTSLYSSPIQGVGRRTLDQIMRLWRADGTSNAIGFPFD